MLHLNAHALEKKQREIFFSVLKYAQEASGVTVVQDTESPMSIEQSTAHAKLTTLFRSGISVNLSYHGKTPYDHLIELGNFSVASFLVDHFGARIERNDMLRAEDKPVIKAILENTRTSELLRKFFYRKKQQDYKQFIHLIRIAAYLSHYVLAMDIINQANLSEKYFPIIKNALIYGAALAGHQASIMALLALNSTEKNKNIAVRGTAQGGHPTLLNNLMISYPRMEKIAVRGLMEGGHLGNEASALSIFSFIDSRKIRIILLNEMEKLTLVPSNNLFSKAVIYKFNINFFNLLKRTDKIAEIMLHSPVGINSAERCAIHFDSYLFFIWMKNVSNDKHHSLFNILPLIYIIATYLANSDIKISGLETIKKAANAYAPPLGKKPILSRKAVEKVIETSKNRRNYLFYVPLSHVKAENKKAIQRILKTESDADRYQNAKEYIARNPDDNLSTKLQAAINTKHLLFTPL
ncbi:MAG: hypothetical protein K0S27_334 [Gammaproteobacteria bacterium]|jgi:hypothetical protein|nr:hypothetical protein [Gammaproteobacteria bacterium]